MDFKPSKGHSHAHNHVGCAFGCAHDHDPLAPLLERSVLNRRRMMQLGGAGLAAAGLAGCVTTNRATGQQTLTGFSSLRDDIALGEREHPKLVAAFGGEYDNTRIQSYIERMGNELARYAEYQEFTYKFTVVNSWVVNAFALPGGYCYVSRGLIALASNEAEIAGVVAHEIGHVNARHTAQRLAQTQLAQGLLMGATILTGQRGVAQLGGQVANAVLKSYSRDQELEADTLGLRYMSRAGYNPEAMVGFLDTLRDHSQIEAQKRGLPKESVDARNINATHPRTIERVQKARALSANYRAPDQVINRDRYLQTINGMLYGDDPDQGITDGRSFVHPKLKFRFDVPDGFTIQNNANNVLAQKRGTDALIVFDGGSRTTRNAFTYLTQEWGKGTRLSDAGQITINGLSAATGAAQIQGKDYRFIVIEYGADGRVWRFRFISNPRVTQSLRRPFQETTYSFRKLSNREASRIEPQRLIVVPISRGDTVASLSRSFPEGDFSQAAFRVLNDLKIGQPLPSSGQVKVVVGQRYASSFQT